MQLPALGMTIAFLTFSEILRLLATGVAGGVAILSFLHKNKKGADIKAEESGEMAGQISLPPENFEKPAAEVPPPPPVDDRPIDKKTASFNQGLLVVIITSAVLSFVIQLFDIRDQRAKAGREALAAEQTRINAEALNTRTKELYNAAIEAKTQGQSILHQTERLMQPIGTMVIRYRLQLPEDHEAVKSTLGHWEGHLRGYRERFESGTLTEGDNQSFEPWTRLDRQHKNGLFSGVLVKPDGPAFRNVAVDLAAFFRTTSPKIAMRSRENANTGHDDDLTAYVTFGRFPSEYDSDGLRYDSIPGAAELRILMDGRVNLLVLDCEASIPFEAWHASSLRLRSIPDLRGASIEIGYDERLLKNELRGLMAPSQNAVKALAGNLRCDIRLKFQNTPWLRPKIGLKPNSEGGFVYVIPDGVDQFEYFISGAARTGD